MAALYSGDWTSGSDNHASNDGKSSGSSAPLYGKNTPFSVAAAVTKYRTGPPMALMSGVWLGRVRDARSRANAALRAEDNPARRIAIDHVTGAEMRPKKHSNSATMVVSEAACAWMTAHTWRHCTAALDESSSRA